MDLNSISFDGNTPLDEIKVRVFRIFENNEVTSVRSVFPVASQAPLGVKAQILRF